MSSNSSVLVFPQSPSRTRYLFGSLSPSGLNSAALSAPSLSPSSSFESLASSAACPQSPLSVPSSPNVSHKRSSSIFESSHLEYDAVSALKPILPGTATVRQSSQAARIAPSTAIAPPKPRFLSFASPSEDIVRDESSPFSPIIARLPSHSASANVENGLPVRRITPIFPKGHSTILHGRNEHEEHASFGIFEPGRNVCQGLRNIAAVI